MKRVLLLFLAILAIWAAPAAAQEKTIVLKKGEGVWDVIAAQGCGEQQAAAIQAIVMKDSGIDPTKANKLPVGTPILIRVGCDGQPLAVSDEKLKADNARLLGRISELEGIIEGLTKAAGEKAVAVASSPDGPGWALFIGACALCVILFVVAVFGLKKAAGAEPTIAKLKTDLIAAHREVDHLKTQLAGRAAEIIRLMSASGEGPFPEKVVVKRGAMFEVTFNRQHDVASGKVYWSCPMGDCDSKITMPANCERHMKEKHPVKQSEPEVHSSPEVPQFIRFAAGRGK